MLRAKRIDERKAEILADPDRVGEIIENYSDVIAAKCVKCRWNRIKVGNDLADYIGLHAYDIAETEVDYELSK
jgi:hypothetical protein